MLVVAWCAVVLVVGLTFAQAAAEARAMRRLVAHADQPDALKRAAERLPTPNRDIVRTFVANSGSPSTLDDALAHALVQTAQRPFVPSVMVSTLTTGATLVAALSPGIAALLNASTRLADLFDARQTTTLRERYLAGVQHLSPAFADLGAALDVTGHVLAGLALAWAVRWWLVRPEVREARLVRALIDVAGRRHPGANAPVATRLAQMLAPDDRLIRPAAATATGLVIITVGWLCLLSAAPLAIRTRQVRPFDVWPVGAERRFEPHHNVELPRGTAGLPIVRSERPSLTLGPSVVFFHTVELAKLENGRLSADGLTNAPDVGLDDFPRPLEVTVLGHRTVAVDSLMAVLRHLAGLYRVTRYHLIVERGVGSVREQRRQAALSVQLGTGPSPLTVQVGAAGVRLLPTQLERSFETGSWAEAVRKQVRDNPALWREGGAAPVSVELVGPVQYERLIEVLSAIDGACPHQSDCGLPGLGVRFLITRI